MLTRDHASVDEGDEKTPGVPALGVDEVGQPLVLDAQVSEDALQEGQAVQ